MEWDQNRGAFLRVVRGYAPAQVDEFAAILDELIRWSREHEWALCFVPHYGEQAVVKFALTGMNAPFWSAYPRVEDGAKLSVIDSVGPQFSDGARELACQELAALDGRTAKSGEQPRVSFRALGSVSAMRRVKRLLCTLVCDLGHHAEPSVTPDRRPSST